MQKGVPMIDLTGTVHLITGAGGAISVSLSGATLNASGESAIGIQLSSAGGEGGGGGDGFGDDGGRGGSGASGGTVQIGSSGNAVVSVSNGGPGIYLQSIGGDGGNGSLGGIYIGVGLQNPTITYKTNVDLARNAWHTVRIQMVANTPGVRNGRMKIWIDGQQVLINTGKNEAPSKLELTDAGRGNVTGLWGDLGRFKTPTIRALAARAPYFHNGIAATLEDVVRHYETHLGFIFTDQERADLVAFLNAL